MNVFPWDWEGQLRVELYKQICFELDLYDLQLIGT